MIVTRESFEKTLSHLLTLPQLAVDTECLGLRPFHGDRLFSIAIAESPRTCHYFNFWPYHSVSPAHILTAQNLEEMKVLFNDPEKLWMMHRFNYDGHILGQEGIEIAGAIHCTLTQARVEHNDHMNYDLDSCLERIGLKKDDKVKQWILDNNAWDWEEVPGKKARKKRLHFERVPLDLIAPYAEQDAMGCFALGIHQIESVKKQSAEYPAGAKTLVCIQNMERRLAKTVLRMERVGIKIDRKYCERAVIYEEDRAEKAKAAFKRETGRDYLASGKLFAEVFACERDRWVFTDKGNPSFEADVLQHFTSPAAKEVQRLRDAKSKADFYNTFQYQADREGVIHPSFNPGGTVTGRFSSSEPNLQNLTAEEGGELEQEFVVRRAFIPRPGFIFIMPDYDQMEYRLMLEYAKQMFIQDVQARMSIVVEDFFEVANKVKDGFDIHTATAEHMSKKSGVDISRKWAKTINFLLLYGGGPKKLAKALDIPLWKAESLRTEYFRALPYVQHMIGVIQDTVQKRGWLRNWAGRKYSFSDRSFAYKGPNYIIQGGCADTIKNAMNEADELLLSKKSRLVLSVHDELPCEIHESELMEVPKRIKETMEQVYPYKHIPLTVSMEWSSKSLADKVKGFPA